MPSQSPILILITSQDWGGAQAYVLNLAKELQKQGLPVKVCAGKKPNSSQTEGGELSAKCLESGIEFVQLNWMARNINPISNCLSLLELIFLFRRLRPSAIQLNSSMMGAVGSFAAKFTGVPRVVYTAHGWVFNEQLPAWKKNLYIRIEKISARWKDTIICLFPNDEGLARSLNIKPRKEILTIPNGINVDEFEKELLSRITAREKISVDTSSLLIGTVANAYPPKNLLWYLDVCKNITEHNPNIKFAIIGSGPQFEELKRKHETLNLNDRVILTGRRMDAAHLYKAFDIFVLPSSKEGMPITLMEAMVAHVPIIATNVGACPWMLKDAGLIVESNNQNQMSEAILKLADNPELRHNLSEKAYTQVKEKFGLDKNLKETVKCLVE